MNAPFPYFGGKSRIANKFIEKIPPHKTYAEAFSGAAWILFKKQPSTLEVLNDLDRHLMNFYRVAKYHSEALLSEITGLQPSCELFYTWGIMITATILNTMILLFWLKNCEALKINFYLLILIARK